MSIYVLRWWPSKCFFSETTWTIETKLATNDHWNVLYKVCAFYVDRKSKMATTAGHRITLDLKVPMIIPGQFGFNCPSGFREEAF
jgi:hypothetical protein